MDDVDEDDVEVELDALDEVKEVVSSVSVGSTGVVHPESVSIPEARRARAVREFMGGEEQLACDPSSLTSVSCGLASGNQSAPCPQPQGDTPTCNNGT